MFDYLIDKLRCGFAMIPDHRLVNPNYSLCDVLMSGFSMFSLKDPSLLSFVSNYPIRSSNLEQIYGIRSIPSEQGLRKILDGVAPNALLPSFSLLHEDEKVAQIRSQHQCFVSLGGYTGIAVDGTAYFCSSKVSCPHCLTRKLKSGTQYHHQLAGACVVHPDKKTVLPIFAEPITRQDGSTKNDCEYNAFKRLVPKIKQVLPDDKPLILLDGLFASGPAIRLMLFYSMDFITVIKEGYALIQAQRLEQQNQLEQRNWYKNKHIKCTVQWTHDLILNGANQDITVNYVQYQEVDTRTGKIVYAAKWITSLALSASIIKEFVKVARSRWKIENETFNVLKHQGYNLEHNYGHGKQFLSSILAILMFLVFLIDQLTQVADKLFQKALKAAKTMRDLRQKVRVLFDFIPCMSMNVIYGIIARDIQLQALP